MDPDVAEFASRIPVDQIPYAVVLLMVRFWSESSPSRNDQTVGSDADKFLTAGDLAERLGVPESWVRTEEHAGRIPSFRIGKYVRFKWLDVERALSKKVRQEA